MIGNKLVSTVLADKRGSLDIYTHGLRSSNGDLQHIYWDGSQWSKRDSVSTGLRLESDSVTATSWGENRLDVFATGGNDGILRHLYWDGSQWSG